MKLFHLTSSALALRLVGAYLVSPPGTAAPGTTSGCSAWVQQSYDLNCADIEDYFGVTETQFEAWNPIVTSLGPGCNLVPGLYYCVQINFSPLTTLSTSTTSTHLSSNTPTTSATMTSSGNGVATPTPTQPGMTTSCGTFHLVQSGDQCGTIAASAGITLAEFYAWNPSVGTTCSTLYAGDYVCVGLTACTPISPLPLGHYCGRVGVPIAAADVGALVSYDESSPYVSSLSSCSTKCLNTPACSGFFFVQGDECHLRYGPISFSPSGNSGSNPYYETSCFSCPSTATCALDTSAATYCGRVGVPIAASNVGALTSYDTGSPYVYSVGICAAQCLNTLTCSSFFFVEGEKCHLRYGPISFSPNGNTGSSPYYDIACFPSC